jgi:acetoin utilization deacetylase AcuC-like enzyme
VGSLSLSAHTYQELFETIVSLASTACRGKLVFALEGGYSLRWVGKIAACAVARMSGAQYSFSDEVRAVSPRRRKAGEMVIQKVKEIQNTFWNLR